MISHRTLLSLAILVMSLGGLAWFYGIIELKLQLPKLDSIGHFLGFFFLTWLLTSLLKTSLLPLSLCLVLYAGLTELGQHYLGFRNGEFRDFVADILGITLFIMIKYIYSTFKKGKSLQNG